MNVFWVIVLALLAYLVSLPIVAWNMEGQGMSRLWLALQLVAAPLFAVTILAVLGFHLFVDSVKEFNGQWVDARERADLRKRIAEMQRYE